MQVLHLADETELLDTTAAYTDRETEAMQRAVLNIFGRWGVRDAEAAIILGGLSPKTLGRWRRGAYGRVTRDLADRMSYILGIHKALRIIFADPATGYRWMNRPNETFGGRTPLAILQQGGMDDLRRIRRYLDSARGGW